MWKRNCTRRWNYGCFPINTEIYSTVMLKKQVAVAWYARLLCQCPWYWAGPRGPQYHRSFPLFLSMLAFSHHRTNLWRGNLRFENFPLRNASTYVFPWKRLETISRAPCRLSSRLPPSRPLEDSHRTCSRGQSGMHPFCPRNKQASHHVQYLEHFYQGRAINAKYPFASFTSKKSTARKYFLMVILSV